MLRVLHVLGGLKLGGSESFVMNLYGNIDRSRIQFDFVKHTTDEEDYDNTIKAMGGKIYNCPRFSAASAIQYAKWWEVFFEEHPEYTVVHCHVRSTAIIIIQKAHKYGKYIISHSHSTSNGTGLSASIKDLMQLPIRNHADYMLACSQEAGEWLFGKKATKGSNFVVIKNAIDVQRFCYNESVRCSLRRQLGLNDCFVIGHVGRFIPAKNHSFLVDLFPCILNKEPNARMLLVGQGETLDDIKKEVEFKGLSDKIIFAGSKPNVEDYYQAMDAFVFPSIWEGLGISLVEAQTSGLPCIVSERIPVIADIGAGLFSTVKLTDKKEMWVDKILLSKTNQRKDRSEYTIESGYDIQANAKFMENFYIERK